MDSKVFSKLSNRKAESEIIFFRERLSSWYSGQSRFYPWTGIKDPYKIWLSEVILQQTRVEQGLPYYLKISGAYPTVCDLAMAEDLQVFRLWQGLGYYNRCKNMLAAARIVCEKFHGIFPDTYASLQKLPGVGPYTAAAVASFAYDLPEAVVDGNVERVLSRFFEIDIPVNSPEGKRNFRGLAKRLLDWRQPAIYNQALMDLGATVCLPGKPDCDKCPLQEKCSAFENKTFHSLPVKKPKKKPISRFLNYYVITHGDRLFIHKRPEKGIWQNLYEFFLWETEKTEEEKTLLKHIFYKEKIGGEALQTWISPLYTHKLTHQTLHIRFIWVRLNSLPDLAADYFSVSLEKLDQYAFPRPLVRFINEVIDP